MNSRDTSYASGHPFLYGDLLDLILTQGQRLFLVQGGVGMGKSTLLQQIAKSLGKPAPLVRGRRPQSYDALKELVEGEAIEGAVYCIDDLDFLLGPHRQWTDQMTRGIEECLSVLKMRTEEESALLVATTTLKPHRLVTGADSEVWSVILQNFKEEFLAPWPPEWEKSRRRQFEGLFGGELGSPALRLWWDLILEMSGGHPTLLGVCIGELQRFIELRTANPESVKREWWLNLLDVEDDSSGPSSRSALEKRLRWHLEDLLDRQALLTVRRALRRLEQSSEHEDNQSLIFLGQLAESRDGGTHKVPDSRIRFTLTASGLAHQRFGSSPSEDSFEVSGNYICREIQRWMKAEEMSGHQPKRSGGEEADSAVEPAKLEKLEPAVPNPHGKVTIQQDEMDKESGWVVGEFQGRQHEISLRTSMWKALKLLMDYEGKTVTHDQMESHLGVSERAARSTIERLVKKLSDGNIHDVVESVWGRGYRLGTKPYWEVN